MIIKIMGAILILAGCSGYGFYLAAGYKREIHALQQLEAILEWMICELECRMTPLPELCRMAAKRSGMLGKVLSTFADNMESYTVSDVSVCMDTALANSLHIPPKTAIHMKELGQNLGIFALTGQITQLRALSEMCRRDRKGLESGQDARLRSYRTLGICAGVALVILFL